MFLMVTVGKGFLSLITGWEFEFWNCRFCDCLFGFAACWPFMGFVIDLALFDNRFWIVEGLQFGKLVFVWELQV